MSDTENKLQELLTGREKRDIHGYIMLDVLPRIFCKDGFNVSVQASEFAYCHPRDSLGPWSEVELGYPSKRIKELMPYCEDPENPKNTVYGYVPLALVAKVLDDHGGIVD